MRYAVTGSRRPDARGARLIEATIRSLAAEVALQNESEFTSGAAAGADTIAVLAAQHAGFDLIRLTVPGAPYNTGLLERARSAGWVVVYAPPGRTVAEAYLRRDSLTVRYTHVLLAFPLSGVELVRGSGTWATVRRARRAGCEIRVTPLDGSASWVEPMRTLVAL